MREHHMCDGCCYENKQTTNYALRGEGKCHECGVQSSLYIFTNETKLLEEMSVREPSNLELLMHTGNAEQIAYEALRKLNQ